MGKITGVCVCVYIYMCVCVCVYVYIVVLYQNKGILLAFIIRIYRDAWSSE